MRRRPSAQAARARRAHASPRTSLIARPPRDTQKRPRCGRNSDPHGLSPSGVPGPDVHGKERVSGSSPEEGLGPKGRGPAGKALRDGARPRAARPGSRSADRSWHEGSGGPERRWTATITLSSVLRGSRVFWGRDPGAPDGAQPEAVPDVQPDAGGGAAVTAWSTLPGYRLNANAGRRQAPPRIASRLIMLAVNNACQG